MQECHQNRTWHRTVPHHVIRPTRPKIGFYEPVESFKFGSYWIICSYISHKTNKSENEPRSGRISHHSNDGLCFFLLLSTLTLTLAQTKPSPWSSAGFLPFISAHPPQPGHKCRKNVFKSAAFLCSFSGGLRKSLSENRVFLTCLWNVFHLSFLIILPLSVSFHIIPLFSSLCAVAPGASSKALMAVSQRNPDFGCRWVEKAFNDGDVDAEGISENAFSCCCLPPAPFFSYIDLLPCSVVLKWL